MKPSKKRRTDAPILVEVVDEVFEFDDTAICAPAQLARLHQPALRTGNGAKKSPKRPKRRGK